MYAFRHNVTYQSNPNEVKFGPPSFKAKVFKIKIAIMNRKILKAYSKRGLKERGILGAGRRALKILFPPFHFNS